MSMASTTSPIFKKIIATACISTTILIWFQDDLYSIQKVQGSSMEPALNSGDLVLVQKADWRYGSRRKQIMQQRPSSIRSIIDSQSEVSSKGEDVDDNNNNSNNEETNKLLNAYDILRLQRDEEIYGDNGYGLFTLYCHPPLILPGEVIIVKSPISFYPNVEYHIKRVIALGGQSVTTRSSTNKRGMEIVPEYSTWIEGDNSVNSQDSNKYGSVSNKLIVGKASYVLWPPSRIGPIQQVRPNQNKAAWLW